MKLDEAGRKPANENEPAPTEAANLSADRLQVVLNFRVTPAQAQAIRAQASASGKSVSDYARDTLLGTEAPTRPRRRARATMDERAFGQALAALTKLGVNLNQLARVANAQKYVTFEEFKTIKAATAELQETRAALLRAFGEEP